MKAPTSKKPIYIVIAVIVIAGLAYFYFNSNPTDSAATLETQQSQDESALVGSQVLSLLNEINALKLDQNLFSDPVYKSLVDHTVVVPTQNVGRFNPFIPVSGTFKQTSKKK